jgi:hypothetical protein
LSAPEVERRLDMRVAVLVRYPFKIFYRVFDDRLRIPHVRQSALRRLRPRPSED